MITDESKAVKRNWMLELAVLGIIFTENCLTMLDKITMARQNNFQFATSHHYHWSLRVPHQIRKSEENYCDIFCTRLHYAYQTLFELP